MLNRRTKKENVEITDTTLDHQLQNPTHYNNTIIILFNSRTERQVDGDNSWPKGV